MQLYYLLVLRTSSRTVAEEAVRGRGHQPPLVGWNFNRGTIQRIARLTNVWKKMELLKFFLRKKLHFLTNNVHVLKNLGGIEDMLVDVMYVVDPHKEQRC